MAARITYNGRNLDLEQVASYGITPRANIKLTYTGGDFDFVSLVKTYSVFVRLYNVPSDHEYKLLNFYSWATQGEVFSFAYDSSRAYSAAVYEDASEGDTSLTLEYTTDFSSNMWARYFDRYSNYYHWVYIDSVTVGTSTTTVSFSTTPLNADLTAGGLLCPADYWPYLVIEKPNMFSYSKDNANTLNVEISMLDVSMKYGQ